ncbi:MAG: hypothetical protein HPY57_14575 [Ignavibacteria bacterium]|nr:hypothetical protein [Ignavibacteria bacterium]
MATSSKFIKIHQNVLLEWIYDSDNLKTDDYQVVTDLISNKRGYMSKSGLNNINNTIFAIDPIIKKYAKIDTTKYNYLKLENYTTPYVQFDKLRLHLPTTYSFSDNGYIGLWIKIYSYDYNNKNIVEFSSFLYNDTEIGADSILVLNKEFFYDEQSWGKYITYDIPSIDAVSKQRTSSVGTNLPTTNSINYNLTKGVGISQESPIFIEFAFVVSKETVLGNTYYYLSELFKKSIAKVPEYMDLAANIVEAKDGDYFEIYGSYGGSNESMDEFIDELTAKGRKVKLEYEVSLFEENILMHTQTFVVEENFTKKLWYRPVLSFTNTTASIDVTMRVIDLVDKSQIERFASISLTTQVLKYGKTLTRLNMNNVFKPKIYNLKAPSQTQILTSNKVSDIDITKVNYPVISDRFNILVSSSPSITSEYKPMGLTEIIINPFGNVVKFNIASSVDANGTATPYDLTKITENSKITLSFKTDTEFLEKEIWQDTDQNDFENGVIVFRIEQSDVITLKKMSKSNQNFYITINSNKTGIRSMLYSGKWVDFEKVTFVDTTAAKSTGFDYGDFSDLGLTTQELQQMINNTSNFGAISMTSPNSNLIIFLKPDANVGIFENYLKGLAVNIYLKKPAGNSSTLTYFYFLLNVSPAIIEDIKTQNSVSEVIPIPFCVGADTTGTSSVNLQNIKDRVLGFNCATADRINQQQNRFNQ